MSYSTVKALFTAICDAIRAKDGTWATINHQDIPARIQAIDTGISWDDVFLRTWKSGKQKRVVANNSTSVPEYQFYNDNSLLEFSSTSITTIGSNAFYRTYHLKELNCPAVTNVGSYAFYHTGTLNAYDHQGAAITLPALNTIGDDAFGEALIYSLDAPNITTIGRRAFMDSSIKSTTTLDTKATSIEMYAFYRANITTLILRSDSFCTLDADGLKESNITDIYVKDELVETYKGATNWSQYASMIKGISEIPTT